MDSGDVPPRLRRSDRRTDVIGRDTAREYKQLGLIAVPRGARLWIVLQSRWA